MIQLNAMPRPLTLTDELVQQLTALFKADKTQRVWNKDFIKSPLLKMSSGKCCYCECRIDEESKYMEVEHFRCKDIYEDDVVLWSNLLPSCKRCNVNKADHDTNAEPMVHPVDDDPRNHLELKAYRFYGKTLIGKTTIEVVKLNERERLQLKRFEVGSKIKEALDEVEEQVRDYLASLRSPYKRRNILSKLRGIMEQGFPTQEYAATVATEILREDSYYFVKTELMNLGSWDDEFQQLESELTKIAFL